jgi:hypothetical protein
MHYYLKKKGIKNNAFMLQLLDPDLAGIDPHDPMLLRPEMSWLFRAWSIQHYSPSSFTLSLKWERPDGLPRILCHQV